MSVDPVGHIAASAAGSPYAQATSAKTNASTDAGKTSRRVNTADPTTDGVSAPDQSHLETTDRDADGRQPWSLPAQNNPKTRVRDTAPGTDGGHDRADGEPGDRVDLVG